MYDYLLGEFLIRLLVCIRRGVIFPVKMEASLGNLSTVTCTQSITVRIGATPSVSSQLGMSVLKYFVLFCVFYRAVVA